MTNNLRVLKKFFTTGTAEAEGNILKSAFVSPSEYSQVIGPVYGSPSVLVGRKGAGKSALFRYAKESLHHGGVPTLLLRPKDLRVSDFKDATSLGELTDKSESTILRAIASKIGSEYSGYLFGHEAELNKIALSEGKIAPDAVQVLKRILMPFGKAASDIDFESVTGGSIHGKSEIKRVLKDAAEERKKLAYVFLDDTDQVADMASKDHLNRIWSLLLASRAITEEYPNIVISVSLRTEVWNRLMYDNSGQRDQTDHFRELVVNLQPTTSDIKKIIETRFRLASIKCGCERVDPNWHHPFFENPGGANLPSNNPLYGKSSNWMDIIVGRSRQRPRDAIQFVSKMISRAIDSGRDKIEQDDFHYVMPEYSEERVDDLETEVKYECSNMKEIVRAFGEAQYNSGSFTFDANGMKSFIGKIPSKFSIQIHGNTIRPEEDNSTFKLWRFLYRLGFINARASDKERKRNYRHVKVGEDSRLVSKERWNDMQQMLWEINPAYRDFLIKVKNEKERMTGLPSKSRR